MAIIYIRNKNYIQRGSTDIDHAIVNSKMKELLFSGSFIDFYPISDHKSLLIKGISIPSDGFIIPKRFFRWDRLKCLEVKESICNDNRFRALETKIQDPNISTNTLSKDFISTAFSIAKDLQITSFNDIIILNSIVISKVSYFTPLLGSNEKHSRQAQTKINKDLGWVAGVGKVKSFTSTYSIFKDLNIPRLTANVH